MSLSLSEAKESLDDGNSLEDMDVEVSSEGEAQAERDAQEERRRAAREAADKRIDQFKEPITRKCRHRMMAELERKISEDVRQAILRQCLVHMEEQIQNRAVADEERRRREREEKARQEAEKPPSTISDMMVSVFFFWVFGKKN